MYFLPISLSTGLFKSEETNLIRDPSESLFVMILLVESSCFLTTLADRWLVANRNDCFQERNIKEIECDKT